MKILEHTPYTHDVVPPVCCLLVNSKKKKTWLRTRTTVFDDVISSVDECFDEEDKQFSLKSQRSN